MKNKLKEDRKRAGLTQDQLAAKSGFSRQTISNIEHGKKKYAHWLTMKCIAEALNATIEEIFICDD